MYFFSEIEGLAMDRAIFSDYLIDARLYVEALTIQNQGLKKVFIFTPNLPTTAGLFRVYLSICNAQI